VIDVVWGGEGVMKETNNQITQITKSPSRIIPRSELGEHV